MNDKKNYLTEEGLENLKNELQELKTVKRKEIAARISDAKELGDLSENAEYQEAKEEQGFVETRIIEIEQTLKTSELIHHSENHSSVQIGSTVSVTMGGKNAMTLTIVGSSEADPAEHRISNESPIGQALLGRAVGDTVQVQTPAGQTAYRIESVK